MDSLESIYVGVRRVDVDRAMVSGKFGSLAAFTLTQDFICRRMSGQKNRELSKDKKDLIPGWEK